MRTWRLVVVLVLLIAACSESGSSDSPTSTGPSVDTNATSAAADETTLQEVATTTTSVANSSTTAFETDGIEVSDEILDYLTAVEELLTGTAYEDAVSEDPDVFVATGFAFCERLTQGEEPADVLGFYVETLTGSDIEAAGDDELTLAGTVLGTAVGHLCPEHTAAIEQGF